MQDDGHSLMLLCEFCEFWQVGLAPIVQQWHACAFSEQHGRYSDEQQNSGRLKDGSRAAAVAVGGEASLVNCWAGATGQN